MRLASLLVVAALLVPALARADSERSPHPASPAIALGLAGGALGAGGLLMILSTESEDEVVVLPTRFVAASLYIVGPSAGHLYVGESGEAVGMSLIRGGAAALFYVGLTRVRDACRESSCSDDHNGELMILGGVGVWTAATVYDLIDAPRAAARANARMTVTPTANGIAIAGTF